MGLKLRNGTYTLLKNGLPAENTREEELLQNAQLRLSMIQGSFPYGRSMGSRLSGLDKEGEHAADQALSLANEALLDLPGVLAEQVTFLSNGAMRFVLSAPWGKEQVQIALPQGNFSA